MHLSILPISLLLSLAAAQSTSTSTSSVCAALPVLNACLASTEAIAEGCASTDYNCLCQKYSAVLTYVLVSTHHIILTFTYSCFDQCPNDPRQPSILSVQTTYCDDAAEFSSSVSPAVSQPVSSVVSATGAASVAATATRSGSSGAIVVASSTTGSSASTGTSKSGAETLFVGAGGVVMGVAGLIGAFL